MSDIGLMPKTTKTKESDLVYANDQLKIVDEFRTIVESGDVTQFIAFGLDVEGNIVIASYIHSLVDGVGLVELGKSTLISGYAKEE